MAEQDQEVFDVSKMEPNFGYSVEMHELEKGARVVLAFCDGDESKDVHVSEHPEYIDAERAQFFYRTMAVLLNSGMALSEMRETLERASESAAKFGGAISIPYHVPMRLFDDELGRSIVYARNDGQAGFEWAIGTAITKIDAEAIAAYGETFEFTVEDE